MCFRIINKSVKRKRYYKLKLAWYANFIIVLSTTVTMFIQYIFLPSDTTQIMGGAGDISQLLWAVVVIGITSSFLILISIVLGIIYFKQMKPIYITILMCVTLITIQTLIYNYISKDTTFDEYFHLRLFYYLLFTTVLFVLLLTVRASILKRKNVKFNKVLYWLLPAIVVYTPIVIDFI